MAKQRSITEFTSPDGFKFTEDEVEEVPIIDRSAPPRVDIYAKVYKTDGIFGPYQSIHEKREDCRRVLKFTKSLIEEMRPKIWRLTSLPDPRYEADYIFRFMVAGYNIYRKFAMLLTNIEIDDYYLSTSFSMEFRDYRQRQAFIASADVDHLCSKLIKYTEGVFNVKRLDTLYHLSCRVNKAFQTWILRQVEKHEKNKIPKK